MYTREMLNEKSVPELRKIALDMGAVGVSKKRKSIVIDKILSKQEDNNVSIERTESPEATPTGAEVNLVSKKDPNEGIRTYCRISSGATSQQFDVAGYTISSVMSFMAEVLNISSNQNVLVNGNEVDHTYTIQPGDNIEFIKPSGQKG